MQAEHVEHMRAMISSYTILVRKRES